jgi:hypothetical protein
MGAMDLSTERLAHFVELLKLVRDSKTFTGDPSCTTINGKRVKL